MWGIRFEWMALFWYCIVYCGRKRKDSSREFMTCMYILRECPYLVNQSRQSIFHDNILHQHLTASLRLNSESQHPLNASSATCALTSNHIYFGNNICRAFGGENSRFFPNESTFFWHMYREMVWSVTQHDWILSLKMRHVFMPAFSSELNIWDCS